jgi:hypothetical protein
LNLAWSSAQLQSAQLRTIVLNQVVICDCPINYSQTSVSHVVDMRIEQVPIDIIPLSAVAVDMLSSVAQRKEYFGGCMAKIVEFYIPQGCRKVSKWFPLCHRGKLPEFPVAVQKSA